MKQIKAAFLGVLATIVGVYTSAIGASGQAKVLAIRAGSAQQSVDGQSWSSLQVGSVLKPPVIIKTDSAASVDLDLGVNGPLVRVAPSSSLKISNLEISEGVAETVANTQMELNEGKMYAIVRKKSAASVYEVRTPVAVCGVDYGTVAIRSTGQLVVLEGAGYTLYTPPGQTQAKRFEVPAGYMFEPTLNNNQGGVVPIRPSEENELRNIAAQLAAYLPAVERALAWRPNPRWNDPGRPFVSPGGEVGSDPAFNLPFLINPTVPVSPVTP